MNGLRAGRCIAIAGLLVACRPRPDARQALRQELERAFDPAATWNVAQVRDSTHLLVQVEGAYFGTGPDSLFTEEARGIARFAVRNYRATGALESVTVAVGQGLGRGGPLRVFRIGRSLTLPAAAVR